MIKIENIVKTYHLGKTKVEALKGVSLEIARGEIVCIMGPSGSGKSTILNMIGCLDKPDSGEIVVGNSRITELSRDKLAEIRANKIGFIFQSFNLIPVMNIYENIEFPLHIKSEKLTAKEREFRIMKLIDEVGLREYIKHKPDELSGGQRQRVAIARALVTNPEIILADEPTANLDSKTAESILELMAKINREDKVTFVFSTHDPSITNSTKKAFRDFLGTTILGYYNVGVQEGIKKDYTSPSFENSGKYLSQKIIKYLDENKINYSKRIRTGGVKYNFETQKFDGAENSCNIIGTDMKKELSQLTNLKITEGRYDAEVENGAVVWKQLMKRYRWKIGDEISFFMSGTDGNPQPYSFIITGVVKNKTGNNLEVEEEHVTTPVIYVNYNFLEQVLGYDKGECSEAAIWERNPKKIAEIKKIADAEKNYGFYAEEGYALIGSIIGVVKFMGYFIGLFILAVLIISTFNINLMGFMERQKEIGTMIAMGAKPLWTIKLLITEMMLFSVIAFSLSLFLYGAVCAATSGGIDIGELGIMVAGAKLKMDIIWDSVAATFLAIIGAMAVSALYPLYLTSKLNPVEVFREGEI